MSETEVSSAAADEKIAFTSNVEQEAYPYESEVDCWTMVSLKAPAFEPTARAAIDLVAVVDKSGSMGGEKMQLVQETLHFVVDQLKETDRLGIVSYDTNIYNDLGLTIMNPGGRKRAHQAVDELRSGSSTNLCGGLERGLVLIENLGDDKKDVSSVLLMTDGQANHGFTSQEVILRRMASSGRSSSVGGAASMGSGSGLMASLRSGWNPLVGNQAPPQEQQQVAGAENVAAEKEATEEKKKEVPDHASVAAVVYTFGFGSDHNATLLEAISEHGGGAYYYIDENEKIPESFADCLGGLLSTVGQNVCLGVVANDGSRITRVHHRRAGEVTESGTRCEVNLGDIQSEESRDVVVELKLPALSGPREESGVVMTSELSYFNAITNMMEKAFVDVRVRRPGVVEETSKKPNKEIDKQRNRVVAAEAMKEATTLADKDQLEKAREVIEKAAAQVGVSVSRDDALSKSLLGDLEKSKMQLSSRTAYHKGGSNFMYMQGQAHAQQRSSAADDGAYATPRKMMMKKVVKKK